jgi:Integrase core domain
LIESWFSKLKERCVWLHKFETREQAWEVIGAYIDRHHHRPHSGLKYRTPAEVARTWDDALEDPKSKRPEPSTAQESRPLSLPVLADRGEPEQTPGRPSDREGRPNNQDLATGRAVATTRG